MSFPVEQYKIKISNPVFYFNLSPHIKLGMSDNLSSKFPKS